MNTRYFFSSITALLIFIYACTGSKNSGAPSADFPGEPADSLVAYIERTPCFGRCPVYTVSIYRSGYVLFNGRQNVMPEGKNSTWLSTEQLKKIGEQAVATGYFELNDEYRNPHLTDFPTIYTEVRFRGMKKRVTHYDSNPPPGLEEMEKYLDSLFNEKTVWTPVKSTTE